MNHDELKELDKKVLDNCFASMFMTIRTAQAMLNQYNMLPDLQKTLADQQQMVIDWKEGKHFEGVKPELKLINGGKA